MARRVSTFLFILLDAVDYLFGNGADFFAGDIGMDGKGEDALGEALCIWRQGEGVEAFEGRLGTHGGGVIDHSGNAFGFELGLKNLAVEGSVSRRDTELDGILRP